MLLQALGWSNAFPKPLVARSELSPGELGSWSSYFSTHAGAAATLAGLVFVAVSINLSNIVAIPGLSGRAAESLVQFLGVLVVSSFGLIPGQGIRTFGEELVFTGVALWISETSVQLHYLRTAPPDHPRRWGYIRVFFTQISTLPFCIAGVGLITGAHGALDWIVPGFLASFAAGVFSAWVLLIEILR